jgi:hypothetical protein
MGCFRCAKPLNLNGHRYARGELGEPHDQRKFRRSTPKIQRETHREPLQSGALHAVNVSNKVHAEWWPDRIMLSAGSPLARTGAGQWGESGCRRPIGLVRIQPLQALPLPWGLRRGLSRSAPQHRHGRPQQHPNAQPFEHGRRDHGGGPSEPQQQQPAPPRWRSADSARAAPRSAAAPGAGGDLSEPLLSNEPPSTYTPTSGSPGHTLSLDDGADSTAGGLSGGGAGGSAPGAAAALVRGLGSAKQLLAQQLHSVQTLEPSLGSLEDYNGFDTLEDARADGSGGASAGVLHGKQASVATFEVRQQRRQGSGAAGHPCAPVGWLAVAHHRLVAGRPEGGGVPSQQRATPAAASGVAAAPWPPPLLRPPAESPAPPPSPSRRRPRPLQPRCCASTHRARCAACMCGAAICCASTCCSRATCGGSTPPWKSPRPRPQLRSKRTCSS